MAAATPSLWHYLLDPAVAMDASALAQLRPTIGRLARLTSPAEASWLLPAQDAIAPDEILRDRLRTRYLRAEARRWLTQIAAAGIDVLPLKGFATGLAFYPDPELRGLGDVDLLARPADAARLAAFLRREGFVFRPSAGTPFWGHSGEASFHPCVAPDGQLAFDLHIAPDEPPLPRSIDVVATFAGARHIREAGQMLAIPRDSHLLLMAASHAARDKYDQNAVRSVLDIVALRRRPDWPSALEEAMRLAQAGGNLRLLRLTAQLLIGLGAAAEEFPAVLARPYRGLAGAEMRRMVAQFADLFAVTPSKLALQQREWLLTGGPRIAARRALRRARGMIRPWSGLPPA
ncbi:MAG: nucleotidyltransferase family protein [Alphaproteobacteria bacterium]